MFYCSACKEQPVLSAMFRSQTQHNDGNWLQFYCRTEQHREDIVPGLCIFICNSSLYSRMLYDQQCWDTCYTRLVQEVFNIFCGFVVRHRICNALPWMIYRCITSLWSTFFGGRSNMEWTSHTVRGKYRVLTLVYGVSS